MTLVYIDQVIADARCQSRMGIDLSLVSEYSEAIKDGAEMPPLSTVRSGDSYYLYDGFHRLRAYLLAGKQQVPVEYVDGDVWDAIEKSCAVNAEHGKRRTPEDVKRAVGAILDVMKHRGEKWNQSQIAEKCAITQPRVSQIINENSLYKDLYSDAKSEMEPTPYTDRWGNQSTMNTANIGKYRAPKIDLDELESDDEEVDQETGEIRNAPSRSFFDQEVSTQPKQPRGQLDTLEFMDYGADDLELTYKSIAYAIIHDYGSRAALRVAAYIKEGAR